MRDVPSKGRLRIAINVADPVLADRIASGLSGAEEFELVAAGDDADAVVVAALPPALVACARPGRGIVSPRD